jgi:hypothetical protein
LKISFTNTHHDFSIEHVVVGVVAGLNIFAHKFEEKEINHNILVMAEIIISVFFFSTQVKQPENTLFIWQIHYYTRQTDTRTADYKKKIHQIATHASNKMHFLHACVHAFAGRIRNQFKTTHNMCFECIVGCIRMKYFKPFGF